MKRRTFIMVLFVYIVSMISISMRSESVAAASTRVLHGKVSAIYPVVGSKGSMTIRSGNSFYRIYTGVKTRFYPPRWPIPGEWVKIEYARYRGSYRAYRVYIR